MESIGQILRRAREAKGFDLTSVAALTKISRRYLEAIETDDRKSLPSGFFYKSFVHQYASVLGMDARPLDAEVERILAADAPLLLPGQEIAAGQAIPQVKITPGFNKPRVLASTAALMLVVLGFDVLWRLIRQRIQVHVHRHNSGVTHMHAHAHLGEVDHRLSAHEHRHPPRLPLRALLIGMVRGMAGLRRWRSSAWQLLRRSRPGSCTPGCTTA